jgi:hypothetical protein
VSTWSSTEGIARLVIRRLETVPQVVEIVLTDRLLKE